MLHFLTLCYLFLQIDLFRVAMRVQRNFGLKSNIQGKVLLVGPLFLHRVERMTIENTHQPGTERASFLETWKSPPCQEKRTLSDLFSQRALVAQAQGSCHSGSMMGIPEMPKCLLVSMHCAFDEFGYAGSHSFPPSVAIVQRKEGKRFPI